MFPCHSVKDLEGYLKTDDRMRLAKERREEREKSLGKCVCLCLCMCDFSLTLDTVQCKYLEIDFKTSLKKQKKNNFEANCEAVCEISIFTLI